MIELRWLVKEGTTTDAPRLQYRNIESMYDQLVPPPWKDVPTEIEDQEGA